MTISARLAWVGVIAFATLASLPVQAQTEVSKDPASERELKFVQGLRERGYHDLAAEYLEQLRKAPDTPSALKSILDFEQGRGLLEEAAHLDDLDRRRELLEQARIKLDTFTRANPNHPLAPQALVAMARLLFERGLTAALQASEAPNDSDKRTRLAEARAAFSEARKAYVRAIAPLRKTFEEAPLRDRRREEAQVAFLDAELQRALVDYEEAQTYEAKAAERTTLLNTAQASFKTLYDDYRRELAGFFAHMWEAKCHEEKGELGQAMAIYDELMAHRAPALASLQRKVAYFRIIVHAKRGEFPLAVDRADEWLKSYPDAAQSDEGIGVRFQLAKNILAQLPELSENDKPIAIRRATDLLSDVVRHYSSFKPEAIELLRKYRPSAALRANQVANLSYDDASSQADSAISTHEWDRAIILLKQAIRRADPLREIEKVNLARQRMVYCYYKLGDYYSAAVLAEHVARNYPKWGQAPRVAETGLAAWVFAYNKYREIDPATDLNHLIQLSRYAADTWPDSDTGDAGLFTLGDIALGQGRYVEAARSFEAIREKSPRRLDALVQAGEAHWRQGQVLREQGNESAASAEAATAQELMEQALASRRAQHVPPADPGYITNVNALAEIHRANGKPKDALALLEPIAQALGDGAQPPEVARLRIGLLTIQLRAHIANGQADEAIKDMAKLEKAGGSGASLTQLYYELGRSLKREMDSLSKKIDSASRARLDQTRKAYGQFLQALARSQTGQTYDSLMFAGESLLSIGQVKEAGDLFDRVLKTYQADSEFNQNPNASNYLLRTRLRKAESLRKQKKFEEAQAALDEVMKLSPRQLEPLMEQGYLLEDWAASDPSRWGEAYNHWKRLGSQLERGRPRRIEYYECQYHAALSLQGLNQKTQAAQVLRGVMTLSPTVGNAEMKAKYESLLGRLTR